MPGGNAPIENAANGDRAIERERADCVKNGFAKIAAGTYRNLYESPLVKDKAFKVEKLDIEQAEKLRGLLTEAMGKDSSNTQIGELYTVYDKFTYKKSHNAEPINVAEDVKQRLINARIIEDASDDVSKSILYNYVAAELLHLAADPEISLSYDNNEFTVNDLKLKAVPETDPKVRIQNVNAPVSDSDIRLAYDINKLDIPEVTDETLFTAVVGLSREKLDDYAWIWDEIFGKGGQSDNIQDVTINIIPDRKIDAQREDVHFFTLNTLNRESTDPAAYNKEIWNKQGIQNGKNILSAEPDDLTKAGKAAIIMALANGMTVKKDGIPVGQLTSVAANRMEQKQISDHMTDPELAFLGSQGGKSVPTNYTLDNIHTTLNEITADIESADNRWFKSSGQYRDVKKALKELNKYVNETLAAKFEHGITFEDMEKFFDKSDALRGKMAIYLDHKKAQILKDPARKTDPDKQEHEQVRIRNMIKSLEKLDTMTQSAEKSVIAGMSERAKAYFNKEYNKALLKTKDPYLEGDPLENTFAECTDRLDQLDDEFYTRRNKYNSDKESLREARDRIIGAVNKKYDKQFVAEKDKYEHDTVKNVASDAGLVFHGEHKKIDDRELRALFGKTKKKNLDKYTTHNYEKNQLAAYQADLIAYDANEANARSYANATVLEGENAARMDIYDIVFGFAPDFKKAFPDPKQKEITKEEFEKFTPIRKDLKAIGNAGNGSLLSNKDFAAIAYGACFTDRAYSKVPPEFHTNQDIEIDKYKLHKAILTFDNGKQDGVGRSHGDMIQEGRLMAQEAMEKYAAGDKQMLSELLTAGLKKTNKLFQRGRFSRTSSNIEMAVRMKNMLDRDPDLKALAERNGLKPEDTKSIETMKKLRQIEESKDRFINNSDKSMTADEQIDGITDDYILSLIHEQEAMAEKANRTSNSHFMDEYNEMFSRVANEINTTDDPETDTMLSKFNDTAEYLDYKYSVRSPMLDRLNEPGYIDELRNSVREMVKKSTLNAPCNESQKLTRYLYTYRLFGDLLENYKKEAPKTKDGKYDIGIESGYVKYYLRKDIETARARKNEKILSFDNRKYNELLSLILEKQNAKEQKEQPAAKDDFVKQQDDARKTTQEDLNKENVEKQEAEKRDKPIDIEEKRKNAQEEIIKIKNEGKDLNSPEVDKHLATIVTCIKLNSKKNRDAIGPITEEKFDSINYRSTQSSPVFDKMLEQSNRNFLIEEATYDKGQNLFANFSRISKQVKEENKKMNKKAEDLRTKYTNSTFSRPKKNLQNNL